jgi:hypothetical protein
MHTLLPTFNNSVKILDMLVLRGGYIRRVKFRKYDNIEIFKLEVNKIALISTET